MKILLIGNPNVGKSVLFSRLTGVNVIVSNYPGTTVEFSQGKIKIGDKVVEIIDTPGAYTLDPTNKAEEVTLKLLNSATVVLNVVDATNLERSLNLTLELIKKKIPMIVVLNFWDEIKHIGIKVDVEKLSQILTLPCIPTCAITGEGIKELVGKIKEAKIPSYDYEEEERWHEVGKIISMVEKIEHKHHSFLEKVRDFSVIPITGIPLGGVALFLFFKIVFLMGKVLEKYVCGRVFTLFWEPLILRLSKIIPQEKWVYNFLIGKIEYGMEEALGVLTTGVYVPFAIVLPYVVVFYFVLTLLEDTGYLVRLAILVDSLMHKVGLHGLGVISMILGVGCNVPGLLSTRILETKRERFIATTLMCISVPCMAQIAMIMGLLGRYGGKGVGLVFFVLSVVWVVLGIGLNKILKGSSPEIFVEIPPYRIPYLKGVMKKVYLRLRWFIKDALPWIFVGIVLINLLDVLNVIHWVGKVFSPVLTGVLGLPSSCITALIVGILRKDVAMGMIIGLGLNLPQLVIVSVILTMYFPCAATFATLIKELGVKEMIKITLIMIVGTVVVGGGMNLVLSLMF